jgi:hypothetical protein
MTDWNDAAPRAANGGARPDPDRLTVLSTFGPLATKTLGRDPATGRPVVVADYGDAATFHVDVLTARTLSELHASLARLSRQPNSFAIRGEPLAGTNLSRCRRLLHPHRENDGSITPPTFRAAPRRWLALDCDSLPVSDGLDWRNDPRGTASHLAQLLPSEFVGCGCVIQATSGAGIKPGIRARLWYLTDRSVSDAEATHWLAEAPVDRSLYRPVQPHYTAAPVLQDVPDPMPWRMCLISGERERVPVPALPEPEPPRPSSTDPAERRGSRYALAALADECRGIVAAGVGNRHGRLNRAAFKLARFIRSGELAAAEVVLDLITAARRAGLEDSDAELQRFLRAGLRAGLQRAGV